MLTQDPTTDCIREEIIPFECKQIPEFFLKKAESELNDTYDRRIQGLREIRELINGDKLTKCFEFDDDFLLLYLRGKKYDVSKAFSFVKRRVNFQKNYFELFNGFSSEGITHAVSENILKILPRRYQDGCTILLVQFDNWDPNVICFEEIRRAIVIFMLYSFGELMTQINGFKVIVDAGSNHIKHIRYITPTNFYLLYHGTQECMPARYKEIHIVNESLPFKAGWFLLRPFLSGKIKKRVHFHSSNESLLKFFSQSVLPKKFGGDLRNSDKYDWLKRITESGKSVVIANRSHQTYS